MNGLHISYLLKQWLSTIALGPAIQICYNMIRGSLLRGHFYWNDLWWEEYWLSFFFGLAFSLPVFIVYTCAYLLLIRTKASALIVKTLLNGIALAGLYSTLIFLGGGMVNLIYAYGSVIIISSLCYRLRKKAGPDAVSGVDQEEIK